MILFHALRGGHLGNAWRYHGNIVATQEIRVCGVVRSGHWDNYLELAELGDEVVGRSSWIKQDHGPEWT